MTFISNLPDAAPRPDEDALKNIPNRAKEAVLPPIGTKITIGPFVYQVTWHTVSKLRFSAQLVAIREESKIVDPATGEPMAKEQKIQDVLKPEKPKTIIIEGE